MKIKVLGCHGGELPRHRTTCFLIDGKLTIDAGAITAALRAIAAVSVPASVTAGQTVTLQGGGSAAANTHVINTYQWTNVGGQTLTIQGGSTATATVTAPSCGLSTLRLTVTDDAGHTDTADVVVTSTSATTTAPATASSTGACTLTSPTVEVAVCPATDSIQTGSAAHSFTATVANTSNTAVTWRVNGVTGGNSTLGTISTSGVYTPPATVPTPATVTVSAVSVADTAVSSSAQMTVTAPPKGGGGVIDWTTLLATTLALAAALVGRCVPGYSSRSAASNQDRCARR